jgi:8-amino-7-oxononanoate synthase
MIGGCSMTQATEPPRPVDPRLATQLAQLADLRERDLCLFAREVGSACANRIRVDGRSCINFISNNYLGFSTHPRILAAAAAAVRDYGIGTGGSPIACGSTALHQQLRQRIARWYGREDCALFPSGYQAFLGAIQATIAPPRGVALMDSLVHRSMVDGVALSRADARTWLHNDVEDLDLLLASTAKKYDRRLILVDSVYSMDGDLAPLPALASLRDRHGALLLLDEAHALGVIGPRGGGLEDHFGLPGAADIVAGTFSKFAGAVGGFVTGGRDVIDAIRHLSSAHVFSASLPPVIVASVLAAFDLLEEQPEVLGQLRANVRFMLDGLRALGFDTGASQTPVIPLILRDPERTMRFCRLIFEGGVFASPVVYPAVPPAESRIRLGILATHTRADLEEGLAILGQAKLALGF